MRDRGLIDRLYREHNETLLRYARKFRRARPIAEDVVQQAWMMITEAGAVVLEQADAAVAMLYAFVRRAYSRMHRTAAQQMQLVTGVDFPEIACEGDQECATSAALVRQSIDRLTVVYGGNREEPASERTKQILRLHLDDLGNKEIAQMVGVSHQAIPQTLNTAIKALRRQWRIDNVAA